MELEQKHYYAFISHNVADEKTAKWLCKRLESYHIPTTIQKEYNAPKHLRPLFLFQTDLAGNKLHDALLEELNDSRFLIVVCSPAAAKSTYVNEGVQFFIDSGRYDKIIPFIIEGTPFASLNGNPEAECFPPALVVLKGTDKELRGINLEEDTKHRGNKMTAVIDVLATMLGVRFNMLWNRYEKEQRRKIVLFILAAICIIMSLSYFLYREMRFSSELQEKNIIIQLQNKNLNLSRDSTSLALMEVKHKNDSLIIARNSIENQNLLLKRKNWEAMEVQARAVSMKALELISEGDIYRGLALIMKIMPINLLNPNRPFVPEMERAIRAANDSILYGNTIKCIMKSHYGCVYDVAIMKNDSIAATTSNDNFIRFWDVKTGEELVTLRTEDFLYNTGFITFSNDGEYFIKRYSDDDPVLSVWKVTKNGLIYIKRLQIGVNPIFSKDGRLLYIRGYKEKGTWKEKDSELSKVYVYETDNWKHIRRADYLVDSLYPYHQGLGYCQQGKIIICNDVYENVLSFRNTNDSSILKYNVFFPSIIRCAQELSKSGDIFVSTNDGRSYIIKNPFIASTSPMVFSKNVIDPFVLSINGEFLATNTGKVYTIKTQQKEIWSTVNNSNPFTGKEWTISNDGCQYAYIKKGHGRKHEIVIKNRFSQDSIILSNPYSDNNKNDELLSIAFGENSNMVIGGFRNHKIAVWDVVSGQVKYNLSGHRNGVISVALFGNNKYALTSSYDQTTRIWDMSTQKEIEKYRINLNEKIICSAISSDLSYIAIATENDIHIYDKEKNCQVYSIQSLNCRSVWFDQTGNILSINELESDTSTTYNIYHFDMPPLRDLYNRYKYLSSYYLSHEEQKRYYLE